MMSTVGSLGALLLWGIDEGLTQIDKCGAESDIIQLISCFHEASMPFCPTRKVSMELRCELEGRKHVAGWRT